MTLRWHAARRTIAALTLLLPLAAGAEERQPTLDRGPAGEAVLNLTVAPCLVREGEADPLPYSAADRAACERINRVSLPTREKGFVRLKVPAGPFLLRVRNDGVRWPIDFTLQGARDPSLPKTRGGPIPPGGVADFPLTLVPGLYTYSSPATGTPAYQILVEGVGKVVDPRLAPGQLR